MLLYFLLKAGALLAAWIPYPVSAFLFRNVFRFIFILTPALRIRTTANYQKISPHWSQTQATYKARRSFENYGIFCLEFLLNSTARGKKKFKLYSPPATLAVASQLSALDCGILLATTHFGNWEVGGDLLRSYFPERQIYVVADGLFSGYGKFVRSTREKNHFIVLDSQKDIRKIFKALQEKQVVCILFDRPLINQGMRMAIGASWMNIPEGVSRIAQKTHCAMAFAFAYQNSNKQYEGYVSPEFLTPAQIASQSPEQITQYLSRQWNYAYQNYPEYWYMFRSIN